MSEQVTLMSEEEAQLRSMLYLRQRVDFQEEYYRKRIDEFTFNSDKMLWVSAALMATSTVVSSYSMVANGVVLSFITALLPACATAIAAFRSLYQWQRQATLYDASRLSLLQAKLAMPDTDFLEPGDYARYFPQLVQQAETVLRNEAAQWGQLEGVLTSGITAADLQPPAPPE